MILAGVSLGGEAGFLVGAIIMLVSNMFMGQDPWTPWQMFSYGMLAGPGGGFFSGIHVWTDVEVVMENVFDPQWEPLVEVFCQVNAPNFHLCPDIGHASRTGKRWWFCPEEKTGHGPSNALCGRTFFGLWIKLLHKRGIYMSIFSEQLKEFISQKQMTVYSLAQKCDMDRSNVYKMVQGRRKPSGQGQVEHMAEALALTPYERGKLLEAYHITSLGEDLYYERKAIIRFIESLRQDESGETIVPQIKRGSFPAGEDRALQGENNVNSCLLCMVEREMEKEKPEIRMICQPEYDFLYKLLSIYGRGKKSAEISHIMCMEVYKGE